MLLDLDLFRYFLLFIPIYIIFDILKTVIYYFTCLDVNDRENNINELIITKEEEEEEVEIKKSNKYNCNNIAIDKSKIQMDLTKGRALVDQGKSYDEKRDYKTALVYYTDGIEKLLPLCRVNGELREYVEFYMGRAEHIKSEAKKLSPEIMDFYKYSTQMNQIKQKVLEQQEKERQEHQQVLEKQRLKEQSIPNRFSNFFSSMTLTSNSNISNNNLKKDIIDVDNDNLVYKPTTTTTTTTTPNIVKTSLNNSSNKIKPQQQPLYRQTSLSSSLNKSTSTTSTGTKPRSPLTKQSSLTNVSSPSHAISSGKLPDIKGVDQASLQIIMSEIVDRTQPITWNDVVGLEKVKQSLNESVILPNLRPDVFKGLRAPPKGLLLFGPPGNGKTMIAKACANESKVTFFSISASSLTSKYVGESEKLVRALFAAATYYQPAIIFIDEIDSILNERTNNESDATRRLKTEILIQFDGVKTTGSDRILVIGATNRPEDLDDAALRRLVKRIYVGLPEKEARLQIIQSLLKDQHHSLTPSQLGSIADATMGYSGFDLTALCKDAAYEPIRQLGSEIKDLNLNQIRPISIKDFRASLKQIRPSVSPESLKSYDIWNSKYGTI